MAKKRESYLKSIAADIDIGYNKLTREETFEVIENSHQVALLGVLERMDKQEVNEKDATGCTKLHWACSTNNPLVVATLLKIPNIDVNARSNFGYTPLMLAAAGCCVHSFKLLLEDPRVDLNVTNSNGVPMDKLIGSESYPCSCSKEFKKKQTQLLQMVISTEKEARVSLSNRGPKDVIKSVLRRGMKTKVGSSNSGQKDELRKGKKRKINAFSNESDDEKDIKKKRKAEGDLGLSLSDNEEKSNSKTEHDTRVKIEYSENTSSKEKRPHASSENHHAVKNCKNLKAKIKSKNLSDINEENLKMERFGKNLKKLRKHGWKYPKRKAKKVEVEPVLVVEELLCNLCGKSFTKRVALAQHLKYAHVKDEDKFHCTECDFKTAKFCNIERHSLLHKPPTLQCNHCEKKFHAEVYRRNHIKIVHTADHLKDFVCSQCGKGFTNVDVFKGHMNMHQGLKPYKCRYCEKCYQNHSNCMAHERKNHPELYVKRPINHLGGIPIAKR